MRMGENSYSVTHRLASKFDEAKAALPEGMKAVPVYNRTELVDQVIATVRRNLCEGRSSWWRYCSCSSEICGRG